MMSEDTEAANEPPENSVTANQLIQHVQAKSPEWIIDLVMQKAFNEINEAAQLVAQQNNRSLTCLQTQPTIKKQNILDLDKVREYLSMFGVNLNEPAQIEKSQELMESQT